MNKEIPKFHTAWALDQNKHHQICIPTVPVIHARIHSKIQEKVRGNIIEYRLLKEWIARVLIKKGGIQKSDIQPTIQDMINLNLLRRESRLKFQILFNKDKKRLKEPFI